jgi:hypothetical protein
MGLSTLDVDQFEEILDEDDLAEISLKGTDDKTQEVEDDFDDTNWNTQESDDDTTVEVVEDDEGEDNQEVNDSDDSEAEEQETYLATRENDRIRALNEKARIIEAKAAEERKQRIAAQKQAVELEKRTVETTKALLRNIEQTIKQQLKQAHMEGDSDLITELTSNLMKNQQDLSSLENYKPSVVDETEYVPTIKKDDLETKRADLQKAPKIAQQWVKNNPWFIEPKSAKDAERQQEAIIAAKILESKGLTFDNPEFYKQLNSRLESLGLAKRENNSVSSNNNTSSTERRKTQDNINTKSSNGVSSQAPKRVISQTVNSGSRNGSSTSVGSSSQTTSSNKVTLTPAQRQIAETMGMTPKEYALELLKIEKARKSGSRMTTL